MNFIQRNAENLRRGNLVLTFIMIAAVLGMSGWMYIDFTEHEKSVDGSGDVVVLPSIGTSYTDDAYRAVASLISVVAITAITLGILVSKANNEYFKSDTAEVVLLFILLLVAVTLATLDLIPDESVGSGTEETSLRETTYAVCAIILVGIALGMVTNRSGIAKMYNVFGTGVALVMLVIVLGLLAYLYTLLADGDTPKGNINRALTSGERNVLIVALSFSAIIVALGFFHIMMEYKTVRRMFGVKSPTRESPKRTSPRRKLNSLRPKK